MINFGEVPAGAVLPIPFAAYAAATGASVTLTGLAVTDIEVYKGTSMTQRASDAGYALMDTDGIDIDGITGIHGFSIDTGDNTDASFYAVGSYFTVVVSAVTIDGQTVNFIAATFRLKAAESVAGYPKADVSHLLGTAWLTPGTAGTPDVNVKLWNGLTTVALPLVPTTAGRTLDVSAGGEAGIDWANVGSPTTALALTGTTIATTQKVDIETIKTNPVVNAGTVTFPTTATLASTTNITAGTVTTATNVTTVNGLAAGVITAASIAADAITDAKVASDVTIASVTGAVGSVTGAVGSVTGAVGSVTGNVGGNVTGSVGSVATGGITRASLAADTGLQSVRSNTAQAGAATSITLDASASATTDFYINHLVLLTGGTGAGQARYITAYNGTTKVATVSAWATNPDNTSTFALLAGDAVPGATAPTAAQVADAVWDELLSGHAVSGSTGEALSAAGSAGDPWITALPGAYAAGQAGYIVGTNVNATISSRATQTSVDTVDDLLDTEVAAIKADTAAILIDTAEIGAAGAGLTALATAANLATVAGYLDTEIAAIKAKTDNLPAAPAATGDIPSAATIADAVWDEATSGHVSAGSTGLALGNTDLRGSRTVVRGTVSSTSPSTTQFTPSALSPSGVAADQFKGRIIVFDNDTTTTALRGQATDITANTAAGLPVFTYTALTTAPQASDTFSIV